MHTGKDLCQCVHEWKEMCGSKQKDLHGERQVWEKETSTYENEMFECGIKCLRVEEMWTCGKSRDGIQRRANEKRNIYIWKREVWMWKEMFTCGKRCIHVERDVWAFEELCEREKIRLKVEWYVWLWIEMHEYEKSGVTLKRDVCMWKDMFECQKRCMNVKRDVYTWKETRECKKKCLYLKRDFCVWKETFVFQNRLAKETCVVYLARFVLFCVMQRVQRVTVCCCCCSVLQSILYLAWFANFYAL